MARKQPDRNPSKPTEREKSVAGERPVAGGVFEPIGKRMTTSQFVLSQIVSLMSEGQLKPGDKLPTERELAALLGIGRPSVREALSALVLLGVVEQSQGRGTFLVDGIERLPVEPYLYQLMLSNERIFDDLLEVRMMIEPAGAALAAERATDEDLAELRRSLELFEVEVSRGSDADSEAVAGTDFHYTLARASGNETLARLLESLRDLLSATGYLLNEQKSGASLKAHRALAEAVLNRDPQEAERLMLEHLQDVSRRLSLARKRSLPASAKSGVKGKKGGSAAASRSKPG